jgi:elongation factor Ts
MLDCKNALSDSDGDFDKAVEALRIKGAKDVGKRAERATAEGLVAARDGALIELNSETDFVAKNAEFQQLADQILGAALAAKTNDVEALKAASVGDKTVEQAIAELSAKIGEKLELRRVQYFDGNVEAYLHKRAADLPPAVGVLVEFEAGEAEKGAAAAHSVALQIAALKAKYLTRDEVPEDVVANERRIAEETAKNEGKPEQAGSPASSRTSCCSISRRWPTTRRRSRRCLMRPASPSPDSPVLRSARPDRRSRTQRPCDTSTPSVTMRSATGTPSGWSTRSVPARSQRPN